MTSISERIAALSPEKREILLRQLKTIEHQDQDVLPQDRGQVPPLRAFGRSGAVSVGEELTFGQAQGAVSMVPSQGSCLDSTTRFPLSFAQERLWFLNQWDPGSAWYNVPVALRLSGSLKVSALERSFAAVIQRHEALRTTFEERSGSPVQVIAPCGACRVGGGGQPRPRPQATIQVPVIDLRGQALARCDQQVSELARAEAQCPFDLASGPLLRVCLLRLDEQEHVLLFTLHHIITDGWSMGVLVREMTTLYQAEMSGEPDLGNLAHPAEQARRLLPELPIQYANYTLWQRQWLQGSVLQSQLAYWREQLARVPALLELPTDRPRPAVQRYAGT